jgi:hypothetical protein
MQTQTDKTQREHHRDADRILDSDQNPKSNKARSLCVILRPNLFFLSVHTQDRHADPDQAQDKTRQDKMRQTGRLRQDKTRPDRRNGTDETDRQTQTRQDKTDTTEH